MMKVTLKEKLKRLPDNPGVYLMKNEKGTIIYVGKAKVLKNRVRQYFMNLESHTPKVLAMVSNIADFEYIITDTETEAFVLECNLIKKYRPHYNILLKDDKQYPYIKITMKDDYPTISLARKAEEKGAQYFGPYVSSATVNNTIELVQKIFHVAHCRKKFPRDIGKERPCLYRSMGQCSAPCQNLISQEEYHRTFEEICDFLAGNHQALRKRLNEEMMTASAHMEYEKAATIRDRIQAIETLSEKQKVSSVTHRNVDVFAIAVGEKDAMIELMFIRDGKMSGSEHFMLPQVSEIEDREILNGFVKQYYAQDVSIPEVILLSEEIEDQEFLSEYLREKKGRTVDLRTPQKGVYADLVKMAQKNARNALQNHAPGMAERKELRILEELQKTLGLDSLPRRIESYDISHISGSDPVGAAIVFQDGKPARKQYIRMKIKGNQGNNDYESMKEVLFRRFKHREDHPESALFAPLPDLILMDGGITQMHAATEILESFHFSVPVFGMVKDEKHRTRGLVSADGEINLMPFGTVFQFLTRVQDEVHKTAIEYHRKRRELSATQSSLTEVEGIGPQKAKALMKHFRAIKNIKNASVDDILQVSGIGKKDAEAIYRHLHPYG